MANEMNLPKALTVLGLLTDSDNRISEMKALTQADRDWFRERIKIEHPEITLTQ